MDFYEEVTAYTLEDKERILKTNYNKSEIDLKEEGASEEEILQYQDEANQKRIYGGGWREEINRSEALADRLEEEEEKGKKIQVMKNFSPVPYSEELFKENKFIYDDNKQFWRYDKIEGIWKNDADQFIKTRLRLDLLGDGEQKKYYTDEVISYIKDSSYNPDFKMDNNPYLIAFKNKVFDLEKDDYIDFSPENYITSKLDIEIEENIKECPKIDKFFIDCIDEEHKIILYEIISYCLFRGQPYQKLFFIHGSAKKGKSVFLNLIEKFLGSGNYSSVEPQEIQRDKFSISPMWMKMANIVSDINYSSLENVNLIKKLTGGDTINIRQMRKEPFPVKLYAKQIFSTNKLPNVQEKTMAWYRRQYLVHFNNNLTKDKEDPFLLEKLSEERELKGLASKCLECLRTLYKQKFKFTYDIDIERVAELYEQLSNPVLMFIKENSIQGVGFVYKYEFEEQLNNWLKGHHFPIMTKSQINIYMRENYGESARPSLDNEKSYRVWTNLRWKTTKEQSNLTDLTDLHTSSYQTIYIRTDSRTPVNRLNRLSLLNPFNPEQKAIIEQNKEILDNLHEKDIHPDLKAEILQKTGGQDS